LRGAAQRRLGAGRDQRDSQPALEQPQHDEPGGDCAGHKDLRAHRGPVAARRRTAAGPALLEFLPGRGGVEKLLQRQPGRDSPDCGRAQFGFNLRGPIRRDKLFFAVSYEGQSIDDGFNVVPGRPTYQPDIWDAFAGTFKAPTQNHTGVVRLTAPLSGAHTLDLVWAGRYYNSETNFGDAVAHNAGIKAKYWIHSAQLRDTYTPTSGFVNELSLNVLLWSHNESPLEPGVTLVYPSITFGTAGFPLVLKETHVRL